MSMSLIAVHGWLGDHRLFDPLLPYLTCAFLDCRGYGDRLHHPGPFTIETIAADVVSLADRLGWKRFHVLGHSMGGMAAQRLMIDVPDRLQSAILLAPVPACGSRIDAQRRDLLLRAMTEPAVRRELIDANTGRCRDAVWIEDLLKLSLESTNPAALGAYLTAWTETDFSREIAGCDVPAVAICGELDPAVPAALVERTIQAWCPNTAVEVLPSVGHYPMREDPAALASVILRHLASV